MQLKKIVSAALAVTMLLTAGAMTSCKKSNEPVKSRRTNVYGATELTLPDGIQWINRMVVNGDKVYLIYDKQVEVVYHPDGTTEVRDPGTLEPGYGVAPAVAVEVAVEETEVPVDVPDIEEEIMYENQTWVYTTTLDGTETANYQVIMPEVTKNGYMCNMTSSDGMLYMLYETWGETSGFYLFAVDSETADIAREYNLTEVGKEAGMAEGDYFYINNISVVGNTAYMNVENRILLYDLDKASVIGSKDIDTVDWVNMMYASDDGLYYTGYEDGKGQSVFFLDLASGESTRLDIDGMSYYNIIGYSDGLLYFQDQDGIAAWDNAAGASREVLNYINCDINSNEVNTVAAIPGDRFVYYSSTWNSETYVNTFKLNILNRIPDEQMQEEIILTIASANQDYELRNIVIRFNRQNTGVRLNIKTYEEYNNEENNWNGASTQLNADITMGKVPDILVLDSILPVESYFSKGVLVDLYPYMDDPEKGINRGDYLENIFKACEQDGKLYSLISSFYLNVLAAKPDYVGSEPGWTMTEMLDAIESMPEGMRAFTDFGREDLKDTLLRYCGDSFLNWEDGTTNFESEEFIRLIEFLKTCPEKSIMTEFYDNMDYENYDYQAEMDFYNEYEMRFYRDTALFYTSSMSNFNGYNQIYRSFAGDATLIGYPTTEEGGNGAIITPNLELGICTASPNRDSAWVFLKYLLTSEEYFKESYGFVIDRNWMEKQLAESEETYKDWYYEYTDEDWERMEDQYSAEYIDFMKKSQTGYKMEHGEMIYEMVKGASRVQRGNEDLMNIINEELSSFFGGGKSAAEAAKIIDSRARIYISENS